MAIPCQPSGRAAPYRLSLGLQGPSTPPSTRRRSSPPDAMRRHFFGHAMLACRDDGRTRLRFPFTGYPRPSPHCSSEVPQWFPPWEIPPHNRRPSGRFSYSGSRKFVHLPHWWCRDAKLSRARQAVTSLGILHSQLGISSTGLAGRQSRVEHANAVTAGAVSGAPLDGACRRLVAPTTHEPARAGCVGITAPLDAPPSSESPETATPEP